MSKFDTSTWRTQIENHTYSVNLTSHNSVSVVLSVNIVSSRILVERVVQRKKRITTKTVIIAAIKKSDQALARRVLGNVENLSDIQRVDEKLRSRESACS